MPRPLPLSLFLPALLLACLQASAAHAQTPASLGISGDFLPPRVFSAADLKALPQTEIAVSRATQGGAQQVVRKISYSGILLRDLLQAAGLDDKQGKDVRRLLLVARARDGYVALFTWGEIFNSAAGENVLVVTQAEGKPLDEREGPLALRSFGDFRPGPRHVKWLEKIEVIQIRN